MGGDCLELTWPTSEAHLPALSLEDDCPKGEGSMLRYFLGDEVDGATGMHLRLLGDAGLMSGSKSMVLFRVAPHAITLTCQKMIENTKVRQEKKKATTPHVSYKMSSLLHLFRFAEEYVLSMNVTLSFPRSYR